MLTERILYCWIRLSWRSRLRNCVKPQIVLWIMFVRISICKMANSFNLFVYTTTVPTRLIGFLKVGDIMKTYFQLLIFLSTKFTHIILTVLKKSQRNVTTHKGQTILESYNSCVMFKKTRALWTLHIIYYNISQKNCLNADKCCKFIFATDFSSFTGKHQKNIHTIHWTNLIPYRALTWKYIMQYVKFSSLWMWLVQFGLTKRFFLCDVVFIYI